RAGPVPRAGLRRAGQRLPRVGGERAGGCGAALARGLGDQLRPRGTGRRARPARGDVRQGPGLRGHARGHAGTVAEAHLRPGPAHQRAVLRLLRLLPHGRPLDGHEHPAQLEGERDPAAGRVLAERAGGGRSRLPPPVVVPAAGAFPALRRVRRRDVQTTRLISRSCTKITFRTGAPSTKRCTFSSASAAARASSSPRPRRTGMRARTLPLTWTTNSTVSAVAFAASNAG